MPYILLSEETFTFLIRIYIIGNDKSGANPDTMGCCIALLLLVLVISAVVGIATLGTCTNSDFYYKYQRNSIASLERKHESSMSGLFFLGIGYVKGSTTPHYYFYSELVDGTYKLEHLSSERTRIRETDKYSPSVEYKFKVHTKNGKECDGHWEAHDMVINVPPGSIINKFTP